MPQGAERVAMAIGGAVGGAMSFAFGNVGPLLWWLIIFVCIDFFTGTMAAVANGAWQSKKCGLGIVKKVLYFSIVALSHGLDVVFSPILHVDILQSITICAYAAGEFGSIVENLEKAGLGSVVPAAIRRLVKALNDKVDSTVDKVYGGKEDEK